MFLPFYDKLAGLVAESRDTVGVRPFRWPPFIAGVVLIFIAYLFLPAQVDLALSLVLFLAPVWLPFLLVGGAYLLWIVMRRSEFIASKPYVLLEIKLPRNLVKTPLAMEAVLSAMHYTKGESNWFQTEWQGQVRPYWSLEIASFEGKVHFFVWTRSDFRQLVENAFYAQYPGVQLVETLDYTRMIDAQPEDFAIWGCDYKHTKPIDAYPIKTYVEYGLDKIQEEPEQVDPFASLIEFFGSIGKGENLWLQFVFRVHKGEKYNKLNKEGKPYTWQDQALEQIEEIRKKAGTKSKFFDPTTGRMIETEGFPNPTKGQMETIAAIERNVSKLGFDVGGRAVYIAARNKFNATMITGMIGLFRSFTSEGWNGLKPTHFGMEFSDYPWEFGNERRKDIFRRNIVQAYRRRQYYHEPFDMGDAMVMSTEELATVFHIPSQSVQAPGLVRIQSATREAPSDLPT
ncbi:hypothetical protein A2950_01530 [Candidatus Kaiserbacteria bacterium RIFCSPLOWO2_01_FULL_55_19]|uniref:DUF8128 domain-containing protein n=1 Tax=Candidatus Kaiserbacteria bacterium RIFCSPLOWO2_01_FULL_55_19 TaxID=1798516 RepID=A0A1F6ERN0_9BACT|nr:MAG: hypothetical protein A2950_01530 [Candidatus Kaiserbacteria bacterium RIFCSPLOWO2_01_FULL_55_19]